MGNTMSSKKQTKRKKVLHTMQEIQEAVHSDTPYQKEGIEFADNIEHQICVAIRDSTEWSKFFQLKTLPAASDWLAAFPKDKKGQTFGEWYSWSNYVYSMLTNPSNDSIGLITVGQFDIYVTQQLYSLFAILSEIAKPYYFGLNIEILKSIPLKGIKSRHNAVSNSKQLQTTSIEFALRLAKRRQSNLCCLMGVSIIDLYPDDSWNFVFGEASIADQVGIFSFARYLPGFDQLVAINIMKPGPQRTKLESLKAMIDGEITDHDNKNWLNTILNEEEQILFIRRCLGVLLHEIGHLFGLEHCPYFQCLMNGANHLQESDATPLHLCPVCLHKLFFAVMLMDKTKAAANVHKNGNDADHEHFSQHPFLDISGRYQVLSKLYQKYGLMEEAEWCQQRVQRLECSAELAGNDEEQEEEKKDDK